MRQRGKQMDLIERKKEVYDRLIDIQDYITSMANPNNRGEFAILNEIYKSISAIVHIIDN